MVGLLDTLLGRTIQPQAFGTAAMPGLLAPKKSGFLGISSPQLMALGAGIAGGDGIGEGIARGLGGAAQIKEY